MDFHTATTTIANNQENQLLLNAIKNKFAAQTATEAAAFSPPKFNIPLLKIPAGTCLEDSPAKNTLPSQPNNNAPATHLNQFLLKQLQEKPTNNDITKKNKDFVQPQLQTFTNNKCSVKLELPILKQQPSLATDLKISSLTTAINKIQIQEGSIEVAPTAIDLTTALASKLQTHQGTPPSRDFARPPQNNDDENFEIPFIDCDRVDVSRKRELILRTSNEYCVTDASQLMLQHSCVEPSAIGRFLCTDNKYSAPLPLKCLSTEYQQQSAKHYIVRFKFDTKSPDDIVLEALNHQRRHYN